MLARSLLSRLARRRPAAARLLASASCPSPLLSPPRATAGPASRLTLLRPLSSSSLSSPPSQSPPRAAALPAPPAPLRAGTAMRAQHSAMLADCAEGERVTVCGWLGNQRRLGGLLFGKLRDSYGSVQVVVDGASAQGALDLISGLGQESVVRVEGTLRQRPAGQANPDAFNGTLEVVITGDDDVQVLNAAAALPITVGETTDESLRLQHRHIDLRRPEMQRNLRLRSAVSRAVREYLGDVSSRGGRVGVCVRVCVRAVCV